MTDPGRRPRVAVLVGNDVEVDARARKYLRTFAEAGLDVVGVGLAAVDDEVEVDGVRVVRRAARKGPAADRARAVTGGTLRRGAAKVRRRAERAWRQGALPKAVAATGRLSRDRQLELYLRNPWLARWEQVLPELAAYEEVFGPLLDELAPDVVHPHDVFLLGVAVRYVRRARAQGRTVHLVYDAREYLPGLPNPPARVTAAYVAHEKEFLPEADRVITVSDPIADELQRTFRLPRRPVLVLNAPIIDPEQPDTPTVRASAGVPDDAPIVLYGGGLAEARGVHTVVEALAQLPGVHLVVVSRAPSHYTRQLVARAAELGCADRYHEVGFVEPSQVVAYFRSATVGIVPLLHAGNHDWALTNKFCEYVQAGLPVVTSDTEVQDRLVRSLGIGAVFPAGDVDGCAAALRTVLGDLDRYRAPLRDPDLRRRFSWPAQAEVLLDLYRELLGPLPVDAEAGVRGVGRKDETLGGASADDPRGSTP